MKRKTLYFEYNQDGTRPLRVPMTEEEFLAAKDLPDRWFISFGDCVLEVTKAKYDKYYKEHEHTKHCRHDAAGNVVHENELDILDPDYVRAINPFTRIPEIPVEDIIIEHLMYSFQVKRLRQALDALSPEDRRLIVMRYFRNQSQRELAEVLGITQQGVSKRISLILRKLRVILADLEK